MMENRLGFLLLVRSDERARRLDLLSASQGSAYPMAQIARPKLVGSNSSPRPPGDANWPAAVKPEIANNASIA